MTTGKQEVESPPADTATEFPDWKTCKQCGQPKPWKHFRPSSYKLKDGTRKVIRKNICRTCDINNRYEKGGCHSCGRPRAPGHTSCEICLERIRKSAKNRADADRQAVLNHYGRSCKYCGLDIEIFLTIDHKNNDGNKHRKALGATGGGRCVYAWLRRHNYPPEFQTLCYNCNCVKARIGEEELLKLLTQFPRWKNETSINTPKDIQ